ncbi:MAG: FliH/SctL family protein [Bdellovibrionales bacterium]
MRLEKSIIKAQVAAETTFEYRPKELVNTISDVARSFVDEDAFRSPDFKISELVAQQAGISQLESDAHQDKINSQVLERLKEIEEKAYQEGYELGLIDGTEKAFQETRQDLMHKLEVMEDLLKRIEELKGDLLIENESGLIKLVYLIAKKIAMRDLEEHREAVWEILKGTVGDIQADERVVVKLSNEDLYFLETLQDKSGERIESLQRVKFVSDDSILPGGCLIETEYGTVNATVEERIERVWQTLLSRMPQKVQNAKTPKDAGGNGDEGGSEGT